MAQPQNQKSQEKGQQPSTQPQATPKKPEKKSVMEKVRSDDRLLGIASLLILIAIFAIGVGTFFFVRDVVLNDDDEKETDDSVQVADVEENLDDSDDESDEEDVLAEDETNEDGAESEENSDDTDSATEEEQVAEEEESEDTSEEDSDEEDENSEEESIEEEPSDEDNENEDEEQEDEEQADTENQDTENDEDGSIGGNGEAVSDSNEEEAATSSGHSVRGLAKARANARSIAESGIWTATNYEAGDVQSSPYTVQLGDTLWEISEGYYGSGFNWTTILNANVNQIGYLPDGSQALIIPGTILTLP